MTTEPDTPAEQAWEAWWADHLKATQYTEDRWLKELAGDAFRAGFETGEDYEPEPIGGPVRPSPYEAESWRSIASAKIKWLDVVDAMEDHALRELCMALREGLTSEQQRKVAMDLLGEPHVSMLFDAAETRVLVPQSTARALGRFGTVLRPDPGDPWWGQQ